MDMFVQVRGTYSLPYESSPTRQTLAVSASRSKGQAYQRDLTCYADADWASCKDTVTFERKAHIEERVKTAWAFKKTPRHRISPWKLSVPLLPHPEMTMLAEDVSSIIDDG